HRGPDRAIDGVRRAPDDGQYDDQGFARQEEQASDAAGLDEVGPQVDRQEHEQRGHEGPGDEFAEPFADVRLHQRISRGLCDDRLRFAPGSSSTKYASQARSSSSRVITGWMPRYRHRAVT